MKISTNTQKTVLSGIEFEYVPAEVIDVDYDGLNKNKLYTVYCKILGGLGSRSAGDVVTARALDANIKNIPIIGEIVLITKAPTAYSNFIFQGYEYYYTHPISIQSSVHHNGLPAATGILPNNNSRNPQVRKDSQVGLPKNTSDNKPAGNSIDIFFPERLDVFPIQPYTGDLIIEGRWGQSIRFGSTVDEGREYPVKPIWKKGLGDTGNPILIISNGTNPNANEKKFNEFILEDIDTDDSSIWMTSGQYVKFTPASNTVKSMTNKSVDLFRTNNYSGNQILGASDRIILNARKQEFIAFAKEGIGLSTEKSVTIDAKNSIELEASLINLGVNANEPAILGNTAVQWLADLCSALSDLISQINVMTMPTGVGPSGPPINNPSFTAINTRINTLGNQLDTLKSRLVFLNKNAS
jgi:hypothetical protein